MFNKLNQDEKANVQQIGYRCWFLDESHLDASDAHLLLPAGGVGLEVEVLRNEEQVSHLLPVRNELVEHERQSRDQVLCETRTVVAHLTIEIKG